MYSVGCIESRVRFRNILAAIKREERKMEGSWADEHHLGGIRAAAKASALPACQIVLLS
jgi:hypothetical protein